MTDLVGTTPVGESAPHAGGLVPPRIDGSSRRATGSMRRANVLGCEIDRVDLDTAVAMCEQVIRAGGFAQHMSINVAKLVAARRDRELRDAIAQCALITADGEPVVWASRALGDPLPARVAGIDLMHGLLAKAAINGYRVYVLGATPEVLARAVQRLHSRYRGLSIVGHHHGYYADVEEADVAAEIAEAKPDILLVAMSSPRKEYFLARHGAMMGVPFVMGVGGSIDVVAGLRRRAPRLLQRLGLEWFFRLAQEPKRLAKRYFSTNTRFVGLLVRELARKQISVPERAAIPAGTDH